VKWFDPQADWPQDTVTGPLGPVPLHSQPPASEPASGPHAGPASDQPAALHEYVRRFDPHADCPQETVIGVPPGPVPLHWQAPASPPAPASAPHAWPVNDQPETSHEYVM